MCCSFFVWLLVALLALLFAAVFPLGFVVSVAVILLFKFLDR